ncbi:MAG: hypothetical protein IT366_20590 [Candidatus Hydrogenedentes bacterium]|nr:hypothetical protein [Candidatus Hydrogenedentota bacterium]
MKRLARVIGAGFLAAYVTACSNSDNYKRFHDGKALYGVLYNEVSNGDSKAHVETLLGPGRIATPERKTKTIDAMRKFAAKNPAGYPDGVQDDDEILQYPIGTGAYLNLAFRDGKLVNFVREDFKKYEEPMSFGGSTKPKKTGGGWFGFGFNN